MNAQPAKPRCLDLLSEPSKSRQVFNPAKVGKSNVTIPGANILARARNTETQARAEREMMATVELDTRLSIAYHEAGHAAMVYWRCESLHERRLVLHADRFGGANLVPMYESCKSDLMVLVGGNLAQLLAAGIVPTRPIRKPNEYRQPNGDSTRIRNLVKALRAGKDDRKYQFEVQERCREIIEAPKMWQAISAIAKKLASDGVITGEECERLFEACGAPRCPQTGSLS